MLQTTTYTESGWPFHVHSEPLTGNVFYIGFTTEGDDDPDEIYVVNDPANFPSDVKNWVTVNMGETTYTSQAHKHTSTGFNPSVGCVILNGVYTFFRYYTFSINPAVLVEMVKNGGKHISVQTDGTSEYNDYQSIIGQYEDAQCCLEYMDDSSDDPSNLPEQAPHCSKCPINHLCNNQYKLA